jgi:hypothetical protein
MVGVGVQEVLIVMDHKTKYSSPEIHTRARNCSGDVHTQAVFFPPIYEESDCEEQETTGYILLQFLKLETGENKSGQALEIVERHGLGDVVLGDTSKRDARVLLKEYQYLECPVSG